MVDADEFVGWRGGGVGLLLPLLVTRALPGLLLLPLLLFAANEGERKPTYSCPEEASTHIKQQHSRQVSFEHIDL